MWSLETAMVARRGAIRVDIAPVCEVLRPTGQPYEGRPAARRVKHGLEKWGRECNEVSNRQSCVATYSDSRCSKTLHGIRKGDGTPVIQLTTRRRGGSSVWSVGPRVYSSPVSQRIRGPVSGAVCIRPSRPRRGKDLRESDGPRRHPSVPGSCRWHGAWV